MEGKSTGKTEELRRGGGVAVWKRNKKKRQDGAVKLWLQFSKHVSGKEREVSEKVGELQTVLV